MNLIPDRDAVSLGLICGFEEVRVVALFDDHGALGRIGGLED